jgi:hypothetical protein
MVWLYISLFLFWLSCGVLRVADLLLAWRHHNIPGVWDLKQQWRRDWIYLLWLMIQQQPVSIEEDLHGLES